jgi:hypothetical protein
MHTEFMAENSEGRGELNTRILRIQKRVIRSMVGVSSRTACRQLFKELNILTLASFYIYWK